MNTKNFLKMFALSAFLLGGINVINAQNNFAGFERSAQNNMLQDLDRYCKRIDIVISKDNNRKPELINIYHEFLNQYSPYIEQQDRLNEYDGVENFYFNFVGLISKVRDMLQ